jgi:hypothetical protein
MGSAAYLLSMVYELVFDQERPATSLDDATPAQAKTMAKKEAAAKDILEKNIRKISPAAPVTATATAKPTVASGAKPLADNVMRQFPQLDDAFRFTADDIITDDYAMITSALQDSPNTAYDVLGNPYGLHVTLDDPAEEAFAADPKRSKAKRAAPATSTAPAAAVNERRKQQRLDEDDTAINQVLAHMAHSMQQDVAAKLTAERKAACEDVWADLHNPQRCTRGGGGVYVIENVLNDQGASKPAHLKLLEEEAVRAICAELRPVPKAALEELVKEA